MDRHRSLFYVVTGAALMIAVFVGLATTYIVFLAVLYAAVTCALMFLFAEFDLERGRNGEPYNTIYAAILVTLVLGSIVGVSYLAWFYMPH